MPRDERRKRVLEAAETVFLEQGYHAATMDGVAHAASMSKKTVYQVFASKAELFEAMLADRFQLDLPDSEGDAHLMAATLTRLLHAMMETCLSPRHVAITRLMIAEAPQSRDMADALGRLIGNAPLDRWLARQVTLGRLPAQAAEGAGSRLFFAVAGETLLHLLLGIGTRPGPAEAETRVQQAVACFLQDCRLQQADAELLEPTCPAAMPAGP
jgi:TetR/AcrR family transcriptional regulator of autoinduction and epiphytic fitness